MKSSDTGADQKKHGSSQPRGGTGALVRNNLVAIGTAAVLTVYSAGYSRTRDAAHRFAEADQAARRPIAPVIAAVDSSTQTEPSTTPETAAPGMAPDADHSVASPPATPPPSRSAAAPIAAAPVDSTVASEPQRDSVPATTTEQVPTPAPQPTDTATAPPPADSSARQPLLKDGEYFGWGTSRHGDIQAGIEIKGGRITAAWVSQCLTRYSCSWISALPGQVVARQSPEVDYVSGATQSTNAFYYAVVEALSRAK
jgi:uncharacterized protein with FMN-binding domain